MSLHWFFAYFSFDSFLNAATASGVLADGQGLLYTAATISVFVHACPNINYQIWVAYFMRRVDAGCCNATLLGIIFPLNFTVSAASNFVPLNSFYVLVFCTCQKVFCINPCISQLLVYLLHLSVWVVCPMIPFPLGAPVSRGAPVSVTVCYVLPALPGLISIPRDFLAHGSHPYFQLGLHICWGCH